MRGTQAGGQGAAPCRGELVQGTMPASTFLVLVACEPPGTALLLPYCSAVRVMYGWIERTCWL